MTRPFQNKPGPPVLSAALQLAVTGILIVGLPLIGIALSDKNIGSYLEFPPLTRYVAHAPFSWWVFGLYAAIDILSAGFIAYLLIRARKWSKRRPHSVKPLPRWGWAGLVIMAGGWVLAWTRLDWFVPLQGHTFCLPWIGYIMLVNGWCIRRSGRSLLTDAPLRFAALVLASALFWWLFEYLNRFVQNWYYVGADNFSDLAYILFATLAFATVLPAVLSTYRLLLTFRLFDEGLSGLLSIKFPWPRLVATVVLVAAAAGLALIGVFPDALFSLLWVSPLLIITTVQTLSGRRTIFTPLRRGDWRPVVSAALAALICGFFWELWNFGSLARWQYTIPFVNRFHLFAMPILGYAGYLPFGLECLVIGCMVLDGRHQLLDPTIKSHTPVITEGTSRPIPPRNGGTGRLTN